MNVLFTIAFIILFITLGMVGAILSAIDIYFDTKILSGTKARIFFMTLLLVGFLSAVFIVIGCFPSSEYMF